MFLSLIFTRIRNVIHSIYSKFLYLFYYRSINFHADREMRYIVYAQEKSYDECKRYL